MTFAAFEMGRNPRVHKKLRHEIDEFYKECSTGPTYETIGKLTYLDSFVLETLRLHPVVPTLMKTSVVECEVLGCRVPAGSPISLDVYGMARDERYWGPDALEFKPERWTPDFVPVEGSFFPFGDGPNNCIGKKLALIEVKMVVIGIVRQLDVKLVKDQSFRVKHSLTLGMKDGLFANVKARVY